MLVIDSVKEISGRDAGNRGSLPGWQIEPRFLSTYCRLCHLNYLHILSEEAPKYENTFAPPHPLLRRQYHIQKTTAGTAVITKKSPAKLRGNDLFYYLLENCGARRALFKPYFFLSFIRGSLVKYPADLSVGL